MKPSKRITRPPLTRKAPIRAYSTLFGPPDDKASDAASPAAASNGAAKGPRNGAGAPRPSPFAAIEQGMGLAYRVSEEFFGPSRGLAQVFSRPFAGSSAAPGSEGGLAQLSERIMRFTVELSSMWMDAARMMPQGGGLGAPGAPGPRWPSEPPRAPQPPARPSRGVAIQIDSKAKARATLDVRGPVARSVRVEPPRLVGGAARITAVKVESDGDDGPVIVSVRVPAKQALGTYVGDVLDADTGAPLGTVTIRITK